MYDYTEEKYQEDLAYIFFLFADPSYLCDMQPLQSLPRNELPQPLEQYCEVGLSVPDQGLHHSKDHVTLKKKKQWTHFEKMSLNLAFTLESIFKKNHRNVESSLLIFKFLRDLAFSNSK